MSVYSVLVGDILYVEPGEILPVDGVFLNGHNVRCDESGATGESDAVRKFSYEDLKNGATETKGDCFLISGSKVLEGVGTYVVTSVGENSFHGKIMMCTFSSFLASTVADSLLQHFVVMPRRLPCNSSSTTSPNSSPNSVPPLV